MSSYQISINPSLFADLGAVPKSVQKKFTSVLDVLRSDPAGSPNSKKLKGYKDLWRYRIGDHRLVYRLKGSIAEVLLLRNRKDAYKALHVVDSDTAPGLPVTGTHPELLEPEPSPAETGQAIVELATAPKPVHTPDTYLPQPITKEWLVERQVPEAFHPLLEGIETEGALLDVEGLPQGWHDRIMTLVLAPAIETLVEQPTVLAPEDPTTISSERPLASYLLDLDEDQASFLQAFGRGTEPGPWLLKGGPGSGKTVLLAYAVRDLVARAKEEQRSTRILVTTFTNALATAARQFLGHLGIDLERDGVEVSTVDALARRLSSVRTAVTSPGSKGFEAIVKDALRTCIAADRSFPWSIQDQALLLEEIEWVILGKGITERDAYLQADRSGRTPSLSESDRRHLWRFHLALRSQLASVKKRLFEDVILDALDSAEPTYDAVLVDEVQDLKPIAIQLCTSVALDPTGVVLTLDPNQSIYGALRGWAETLPPAMAAPRSVTLRRNHRSTMEIWDAQQPLLAGLQVHDPETLGRQGALSGPIPRIVPAADRAAEAEILAAFLHESLIEERASLGCAAVLCPTNFDVHSVAKALPSRLRARAMESKDLDLDHDGVKVLTMHAAKGLQFPVVVVARMDRGRFPTKPAPGIAREVHEQQSRRVLFVACSRAMRRLMVVHTAGKPSPLLEGLDDGAWIVEP